MNHVIYNGTDLTTFGLYVSGDKTFDSPEKNYTKVSIPGRSGDLFIWDGTYKNVKLKYSSILIEDFDNNAENLRNFLLSANGYVRLEDDYHPDEYRLAVYSGPLSFKPVRLLAGTTTLEFNCRPERFLKSGELVYSINSTPYQLVNPTLNPSYPLFEVQSCEEELAIGIGAGSSLYAITVTPRNYSITIDCECMDCYKTSDHSNANSLVTFNTLGFPKLAPGNNTVSVLGVEGDYASIKPRWYVL